MQTQAAKRYQKDPTLLIADTAWTGGVMAGTVVITLLFEGVGFSEATIIMAFLLGVLLVAAQTTGYVHGITASVIGVLAFNYFFTEPRYSLTVHDPQYLVTFTIMLVVAVMTSTLTARVKRQADLSALRERRSEMLYQVSQSMLKTQGVREICLLVIRQTEALFGHPVTLFFPDEHHVLSRFHEAGITGVLEYPQEQEIAQWVFRTGTPAGTGTELYSASPGYFVPIIGQTRILGVIEIRNPSISGLDLEQRALLDGVSAQIALALEREKVMEAQRQSEMEVERERLRSTLLRAISHDLRTPLTGISGAAGTILDNYDALDDSVKKRLLEGIGEDVQWLIRLIENLLSMTRIEAGKPDIRKSPEAVEEVVAEAVAQVRKRSGNRRIAIRMPETLILVPMDGNLIEQVLINLLDNAVKYTPDETEIDVIINLVPGCVQFAVADTGNGISEKDLPNLFNQFYTGEGARGDSRKGSGLGLAICRSIVQAHGGEISAENRPEGGAVFRFTIPMNDSEEVPHE